MISKIIFFSATLALTSAEIEVDSGGVIMCRSSCGHCRRKPGHKHFCEGCRTEGQCSDGHEPCKGCRNTGNVTKHVKDLFVRGMEEPMNGIYYMSPADRCQRCEGRGRGVFIEIEASGLAIWCPFCDGTGTAQLTHDAILCPDCHGKQPKRGFTCMCPVCKPCNPKCKKPQHWDEDGFYRACQAWDCGSVCYGCAGTGRLITKFVTQKWGNNDIRRVIFRVHREGQKYAHWVLTDGERCDQCEGGEFTLTRGQCETTMVAVKDDQTSVDVEGVLRSFLLCSKCEGTGTQVRYKYVAPLVSRNSGLFDRHSYRCTNFPEDRNNGKWTKA